MNTIPTKLPPKIQRLFQKIENNLDAELYFYGSVTRSDYIQGKSDIDVAVFTDNEYSDVNKLQHILGVHKPSVKKIAWKLNETMIYGYKIKIEDINCEISIFNNNFKEVLVDEYTKPNKNQSVIIHTLLYMLKLFYYQIPLIPKQTYVNLKKYILNEIIAKKDSEYRVIT
jgi:hypothetical protein